MVFFFAGITCHPSLVSPDFLLGYEIVQNAGSPLCFIEVATLAGKVVFLTPSKPLQARSPVRRHDPAVAAMFVTPILQFAE